MLIALDEHHGAHAAGIGQLPHTTVGGGHSSDDPPEPADDGSAPQRRHAVLEMPASPQSANDASPASGTDTSLLEPSSLASFESFGVVAPASSPVGSTGDEEQAASAITITPTTPQKPSSIADSWRRPQQRSCRSSIRKRWEIVHGREPRCARRSTRCRQCQGFR
jgi:hypothetical protein